ncbi:MAG: (d)CMP kinase [Chloroflexota bacterium]|nr:(d)CMP kinase [Chloroflexota bacterium]
MALLPRSIAIDGPAGAGKSTLGRLLADRLHYLFLDTGAMYRTVALAALRKGIAPSDEPQLHALVETLPIRMERPAGEKDGRAYTVRLGVEDVTWEIRKPAVEAIVSEIASWPSVRDALVRQQRKMSKEGPVVMVGRDITTVVLPHADLKIYLDASLHERAQRRRKELADRGMSVPLTQVEKEIEHRDDQDMHREAGALKLAPDAVPVNTDGLDIDESLQLLMRVVESHVRR